MQNDTHDTPATPDWFDRTPDSALLKAHQIIGGRKGPHNAPRLVPVSRTTLWRWIREGKFPKPQKLGDLNAWSCGTIRAYLKASGAGQGAAGIQ